MNPIDQEFAMIFNNSSYRIINQNNLELLDVYYDSIINPLSILPNNINFTHLNDIYVNSSEEPINISPITISDNLNNSIIDDVSIFINRNESTDDLFNLINNWINSISINNNIYVNYLEQTEPESLFCRILIYSRIVVRPAGVSPPYFAIRLDDVKHGYSDDTGLTRSLHLTTVTHGDGQTRASFTARVWARSHPPPPTTHTPHTHAPRPTPTAALGNP